MRTDSKNWWFRYAHRYPGLFRKYLVELPGHIGLELPTKLTARFLKHGFKQVRCQKLVGAVWDCGSYAAIFSKEYEQTSAGIRLLVGLDRLLARQLLLKEAINFALEPIAQVSDRLTPIDNAAGIRVVFEK